jgi:hypothetical protein
MDCEEQQAAMWEAYQEMESDLDQVNIDRVSVYAQKAGLTAVEGYIAYTFVFAENPIGAGVLIGEVIGLLGISASIYVTEWQLEHDTTAYNQSYANYQDALQDWCECVGG